MEKTITEECPVCFKIIGVKYDEGYEKQAIERLEVYFHNHVLNCGR